MPSQETAALALSAYLDGERNAFAAVLHNADQMSPDRLIAWLKAEIARLGAQLPPNPDEKFAIVEIMGHRRHYGRIAEVTCYGVQMIEITDGRTGQVHRYGGQSIYGITEISHDEYDRYLRLYGPPPALPRAEGVEDEEAIAPHLLGIEDRF